MHNEGPIEGLLKPLNGLRRPLKPLNGLRGPLKPLNGLRRPLKPLNGVRGPLKPPNGLKHPLKPLNTIERFDGLRGPLEPLNTKECCDVMRGSRECLQRHTRYCRETGVSRTAVRLMVFEASNALQDRRRDEKTTVMKLASLGIMGADLRAPTKPLEPHGTMVLKDLRGTLHWAHIMPRGVRSSDRPCNVSQSGIGVICSTETLFFLQGIILPRKITRLN